MYDTVVELNAIRADDDLSHDHFIDEESMVKCSRSSLSNTSASTVSKSSASSTISASKVSTPRDRLNVCIGKQHELKLQKQVR